jgi:uncharacterized protein YxjI
MNMYMKQKVFSWGDKFNIYDAEGGELYSVWGEVFSLGKKLHIEDMYGRELAYIRQKLVTFLPKFFISRDEHQVAEVVKKFTFLRHKYEIRGLEWVAEGNFWSHEFQIRSMDGHIVAEISKKWISWGDSYEISVTQGEDAVNVLAVVLVIDACIQMENDAASSSASASSSN